MSLNEATQRRMFLGMLEWAAIISLILLLTCWAVTYFADLNWSSITLSALKLSFAFFFLTAGMRFALSVVDRLKSGPKASNG